MIPKVCHHLRSAIHALLLVLCRSKLKKLWIRSSWWQMVPWFVSWSTRAWQSIWTSRPLTAASCTTMERYGWVLPCIEMYVIQSSNMHPCWSIQPPLLGDAAADRSTKSPQQMLRPWSQTWWVSSRSAVRGSSSFTSRIMRRRTQSRTRAWIWPRLPQEKSSRKFISSCCGTGLNRG